MTNVFSFTISITNRCHLKSISVLTFQWYPVALPLALGCRLNLLILLMHQEVLHSQGTCLAYCTLRCLEKQCLWQEGRTRCATASLITDSRPRLLKAFACLPWAYLKLLSKVLIHSLAFTQPPLPIPSSSTAASTAAPDAGSRVHGERSRHGLAATWLGLGINSHTINATVSIFTALTCCDVLWAALRTGFSAF